MIDRIDIRVTLRPLRADQLITTSEPAAPSAEAAERVVKARAAAAARWGRVNGSVPGPDLRRTPWRLPAADVAGLRSAVDRGWLSARGFDRVLRLAWTVADLDGRDRPGRGEVDEAIQLRMGEARDRVDQR